MTFYLFSTCLGVLYYDHKISRQQERSLFVKIQSTIVFIIYVITSSENIYSIVNVQSSYA